MDSVLGVAEACSPARGWNLLRFSPFNPGGSACPRVPHASSGKPRRALNAVDQPRLAMVLTGTAISSDGERQNTTFEPVDNNQQSLVLLLLLLLRRSRKTQFQFLLNAPSIGHTRPAASTTESPKKQRRLTLFFQPTKFYSLR